MSNSKSTGSALHPTRSLLGLSLLSLAMAAPFAQAQPATAQEDLTVSGSVAVGAEHNDNLSVSQLESASGRSDSALTTDASVNLLWKPADKLTAETGYSYTMSRYQELESYDLDMHLLFADVSYEFKPVTLGGNYYFADADLGRESFLSLNQYSLYAGKLLGEAWYLRGALNFSEKDFDLFTTRDADNDGFSVDAYHFFNQGRSSVSVSYAYEDENTRDAAFAYTANTLRLRLNHSVMLGTREAKLQLGYRLQDRNYDAITPSINAVRDDTQNVVDAKVEVPIVEQLALLARWEHGDYSSKLPSADYTDNRISLALEYTF